MGITELERFEAKVDKSGDCHEWTASFGNSGYGQFYFNYQKFSAHRKAYELYHGAIPEGMFVLHRCDNKKCVNPEHLFLGAHKENMQDKTAKGRQIKGSGIEQAVLTDPQVVQIKQRLRQGDVHTRIAKDFGVSRATISMISNGTNWRHVA